jgi:hypothetical protein
LTQGPTRSTVKGSRRVAQPGSALPWGGRGRRFESSRADQHTPKGPSSEGPFGVFRPSGSRGFEPPNGLAEARLDVAPNKPGGWRSQARSNPAPVLRRQKRSTANLRVGSWRRHSPPNAPCPAGCSHSPFGLAEVEPLWRRSETGIRAKPGAFESRPGAPTPKTEDSRGQPIMMLRPRGARLGRRHQVACTHHPSGLRPSGIVEAPLDVAPKRDRRLAKPGAVRILSRRPKTLRRVKT